MCLQWVWGGLRVCLKPLPGDVNSSSHGGSFEVLSINKLDSGIENTISTQIQHILSCLDYTLGWYYPILEFSYAVLSHWKCSVEKASTCSANSCFRNEAKKNLYGVRSLWMELRSYGRATRALKCCTISPAHKSILLSRLCSNGTPIRKIKVWYYIWAGD